MLSGYHVLIYSLRSHPDNPGPTITVASDPQGTTAVWWLVSFMFRLRHKCCISTHAHTGPCR